jgi:RHS repeat-associated protein
MKFRHLLAAMLLTAAWPTMGQAITVTYTHTGAQGSVVALTDQDRNVLERREFEPYGLPSSSIDGEPGYTGHVHDSDSGLVYMQQRYYDPVVGRFLSVDPDPVRTDTAWNFNRYAYANNSPYNYVDPDGRAAACLTPVTAPACGKAAVAVGGKVVAAGKKAKHAIGIVISFVALNEASKSLSGGTPTEQDAIDRVTDGDQPSNETSRGTKIFDLDRPAKDNPEDVMDDIAKGEGVTEIPTDGEGMENVDRILELEDGTRVVHRGSSGGKDTIDIQAPKKNSPGKYKSKVKRRYPDRDEIGR